jgi:hypothetical protein
VQAQGPFPLPHVGPESARAEPESPGGALESPVEDAASVELAPPSVVATLVPPSHGTHV